MVVKTEVIQIKREVSPKYFYLRSDKGDLKGFQTNFEKFFSQESVTIWHISIRESIRTKSTCTHLKKKNNGTGFANELEFNDCHDNVFFKKIQWS